MTVVYPKLLPLPTIEGYGIKPGEAIIRTEMESGPARQRREFEQVPSEITVKWKFDRSEFGIFEAWYKWKAKEGASWFTIELLGGLGLIDHEARFTSQWTHNLISGTLCEINAVLEIRERPTLDEGALDLALSEDINGLIAAIEHLYDVANNKYPQNLAA